MKQFLLLALISYGLIAHSSNKGDDLADFGAQSISIGEQSYLALTLKNTKGWHTYWKNPGDAGLPFEAKFTSNGSEVILEEMDWPVPHKYVAEGDVLSYGYEGVHTFFYKIPRGHNASNFLVKGHWLICRQVCIPGAGELSGNIENGKFISVAGNEIELSESDLKDAYDKIPLKIEKPNRLEITLAKSPDSEGLYLYYKYKGPKSGEFDAKMNLLTPYPAIPLGFKREKLYQDSDGNLIGVHQVDWDGDFQEPEILLPKDGVFAKPVVAKFLINEPGKKKIAFFEYTFKNFETIPLSSLMPDKNKLKEIAFGATVGSGGGDSGSSLLYILLFALLGGLILNLMPCVLPVISLKLFGLIAHSDCSKEKILKHNLAYTAGVLTTFWAFAAIILSIKATGEEIGWGFQLQSPLFVMCMLLFLFILSLNLFGLFEFATPGGRVLGNKQMKEGFLGDYVSGVLATILSTPCSAPFLGTALTYAFTTSSFNTFLVFTFIGLGLSSPFIITALFPKLICFLPKPGSWMDKLKNFLGLTLLITCAWLYDVLINLVEGRIFNIHMNILLILVFFGIYFYQKIGKGLISKLAFLLLPLLTFSYIIVNNKILLKPLDENTQYSSTGQWEAWSKGKMNNTKDRPVFVDFTAKWCLTCKVNKKLVLDTGSFYKFAEDNNIKLMKADWTKRDDKITKFLKSYGAVGVPAYFVKTANGEIKYLGETISIDKVKKSL